MLNSLAAPLASAAHAADHAALTLASVPPARGMDRFLEAMADNFEITMVFGVGGIVALAAIFFGTICSTGETKEIERTKRELAAYVAEGSMTPEDAERILAKKSKKSKSC